MLTDDEKTNLIRSVEVFACASESTLAKLVDLSEEVSFPMGEEIIMQGRPCTNRFILISGEIWIYLKDGDAERETARLNLPGKWSEKSERFQALLQPLRFALLGMKLDC